MSVPDREAVTEALAFIGWLHANFVKAEEQGNTIIIQRDEARRAIRGVLRDLNGRMPDSFGTVADLILDALSVEDSP